MNVVVTGFNNNLSEIIKLHIETQILEARVFILDINSSNDISKWEEKPDLILANSDSFSFNIFEFLARISSIYTELAAVICMNTGENDYSEFREKIISILETNNISVIFKKSIYDVTESIRQMIDGGILPV